MWQGLYRTQGLVLSIGHAKVNVCIISLAAGNSWTNLWQFPLEDFTDSQKALCHCHLDKICMLYWPDCAVSTLAQLGLYTDMGMCAVKLGPVSVLPDTL